MYRRSPFLVCFWEGKVVYFENYWSRKRVRAAPLVFEVLQFFDRWRPAEALSKKFPNESRTSLRDAVTALERHSLLERSDRRSPAAERALKSWKDWSPAATLLHFSTKDGYSPPDLDAIRVRLRKRAKIQPIPPPVKQYARAPQVPLPTPAAAGEFPRLLLARRTWRKFSPRPIVLATLSTLLGLSFGVQWWVNLRGIGRVALKTSPSAGARHPIEAYVLALRVKGLPRGLYHYAADKHRLELLRPGATPKQAARYLAGQWWFGSAATIILLTAVFSRVQWKYSSPRAYRTVLIDAGHACQTFCLVATWLGLAPFCTMAVEDSFAEKAIGLDGVGESVLYAAGVGLPPEGSDWEPWPTRAFGTRRRNPRFAYHSAARQAVQPRVAQKPQ